MQLVKKILKNFKKKEKRKCTSNMHDVLWATARVQTLLLLEFDEWSAHASRGLCGANHGSYVDSLSVCRGDVYGTCIYELFYKYFIYVIYFKIKINNHNFQSNDTTIREWSTYRNKRHLM